MSIEELAKENDEMVKQAKELDKIIDEELRKKFPELFEEEKEGEIIYED